MILSPGRYVRVPENAPALDQFHYFGSRDWVSDDEMPDPRFGEWDGERTYYNGVPPDKPLLTSTVGSTRCFDLDPNPDPPPNDFYAGFPTRCFDRDDQCVSEFERCDVTTNRTWKNFATIICLLYEDTAAAVDAFYELFPETIEHVLGEGLLGSAFFPPSLVARTPCQTIVCSAGTVNELQLSVQMLYASFPPVRIGPFWTLPLWWQYAQKISELIGTVNGTALPMFLAGHSYGAAALTVLAAVAKRHDRTKIVRTMTYGMPRPGTTEILQFLEGVPMTNLVTIGDPVPQMPPNPLGDFGLNSILGNPLLSQWATLAGPNRQFLLATDGTATQIVTPAMSDVVLQQAATAIAIAAPFPFYAEHKIKYYLDCLYAMQTPLQTCRSIVTVPSLPPALRCC